MAKTDASSSYAVKGAEYGWISGSLWILLGIILLFWPITGVSTFVFLLSIYLLINGIFSVIFSLAKRESGWGWHLTGGIISILLGLWGMSSPALFAALGATVTFYIIVIGLLLVGITLIIASIGMSRWGLLVAGIVSIVISILGFMQPLFSLRVYGYVIAIAMILGGIAMIVGNRKSIGRSGSPSSSCGYGPDENGDAKAAAKVKVKK